MIGRVAFTVAVFFALVSSTGALIAPVAASAGGGSPTSAPITSSFVDGDATWLVVPMGHLHDFLNTFWQLFVRTPADSGWVTVTPPGVADNGGLVITAAPSGALLAGFLTSVDLTFSPLSLTTDVGHAWTAVYFPEALLSVPDALGGTTTGAVLGLGRSGGGRLLEAGADLGSWRSVTTQVRLGRSAAGGRCGVERLSATAVGPDGEPLVGTACRRPGVVGLFDVAGGAAKEVALPSSPTLAGATDSVLRLVPTPTGVAALLEAHERTGRRALLAGWVSTGVGPATISAPLEVPPGARLLASGTTPGGGVFVLLQPEGSGSPELAEVTGSPSGRAGWSVLPRPPRGTLDAAFSAGRIDAVTVQSSTLIDYTLDQSSATWVRSQVVHVPIQYGSSG